MNETLKSYLLSGSQEDMSGAQAEPQRAGQNSQAGQGTAVETVPATEILALMRPTSAGNLAVLEGTGRLRRDTRRSGLPPPGLGFLSLSIGLNTLKLQPHSHS